MVWQTMILLFLFLVLGEAALGQDVPLTGSQGTRFGITLQLNNPSHDDLHVGWYNIDSESVDDHHLLHQSYSFGIAGHYLLNQATFLRLRLAQTSIWIDEYQDYRNKGLLFSKNAALGRQTKAHLAPGIIWKLRKRKAAFCGGFEIPLNLHGQYRMEHLSTDSMETYGIVREIVRATTLPRGISVGISALTGFDYYLVPRLSLGAEFSSSLLYAKLSGKTTTQAKLIKPFEEHQSTTHTEDQNSGFTFYENRFSVNVSWWFGKSEK